MFNLMSQMVLVWAANRSPKDLRPTAFSPEYRRDLSGCYIWADMPSAVGTLYELRQHSTCRSCSALRLRLLLGWPCRGPCDPNGPYAGSDINLDDDGAPATRNALIIAARMEISCASAKRRILGVLDWLSRSRRSHQIILSALAAIAESVASSV